jgi:hypothetical protein
VERDIPRITPDAQMLETPNRFDGVDIPICDINILDQPRRTFEEIDMLAQDIAIKNLMMPLIVVSWDAQGAQQYIDLINKVWKTNRTLSDLKPVTNENDERYIVLLDGERRLRACKQLDTIGCTDCQLKFGKQPCYERHFGTRTVRTSETRDISSVAALRIQASANMHHNVPLHEDAIFYQNYWGAVKEMNPKYTLAQTARDLGRNPASIRDALQYCKLPEEIQEYVKTKEIGFGVALEIQRAIDVLELDEDSIKYWVNVARLDRLSTSAYAEKVSNAIQAKLYPQTMLGIFNEYQEEEFKKAHHKKVVAKDQIYRLWDIIRYFTTVEDMFESGDLGKDDSPYSSRSPLRVYRALIAQQKRLIPHLGSLMHGRERNEAIEVLDVTEELIISLLDDKFTENELVALSN